MTNVDAKFKFAYLVSVKKAEAILILCVTAMLMSIGFFFGDGNNPNYDMIYAFAHKYVWGSLFAIYAGIKFLSYWGHVSYFIRMMNGVIGLWAWNYIFLSFAMFDSSPLAPTELLLAVPILAEAWILLSYTSNRNKLEQKEEKTEP